MNETFEKMKIKIVNSGTKQFPCYQVKIDGKEICLTDSMDNANRIVNALQTTAPMVSKERELLKRAYGLIGNPGANISASCNMACDNWRKEYEELAELTSVKPHQVISATNDTPFGAEIIGIKAEDDDVAKTEIDTGRLVNMPDLSHPEEVKGEPCPNCKETKQPCACMRNKCIKCGNPVGNITFTVCDDCWDKSHPSPDKPEISEEDEIAMQDKFHELLNIEGIENRAFFTSNEFHTIWNAVKKFQSRLHKPEITKEEIEKEAKNYAREHSEAPDKCTPDWIIADFSSGAKWAISRMQEKERELLIRFAEWYYCEQGGIDEFTTKYIDEFLNSKK